MPERHRGPHPQDAKCFGEVQLARLKTAAGELAWLLSRGYSMGASNELVGDHHQLTSRQRLAIARVVCAEEQVEERQAKQVPLSLLKEKTVIIDGFNLLITIETALGGGAIFNCLDGCCRDLSAVYGSYKIVAETRQAITLIGRTLEQSSPQKVVWLFDRPVSNSGRVAEVVRELGEEHNWPFEAETTDSTDALLSRSSDVVISCDSAILEQAKSWCNLACETITRQIPEAWTIDLTGKQHRGPE
ncbi:DUF434 domain-containing protein [Sulfurimonas sp. HSL3-7]|uniref:DUF434 domain-containing protein n=1 Tax=Sulfonitrofixus jiaomeiensis TaxID=3131938 RepID=UPI0031F7C9CA